MKSIMNFIENFQSVQNKLRIDNWYKINLQQEWLEFELDNAFKILYRPIVFFKSSEASIKLYSVNL